jgi:hypothetical protein
MGGMCPCQTVPQYLRRVRAIKDGIIRQILPDRRKILPSAIIFTCHYDFYH